MQFLGVVHQAACEYNDAVDDAESYVDWVESLVRNAVLDRAVVGSRVDPDGGNLGQRKSKTAETCKGFIYFPYWMLCFYFYIWIRLHIVLYHWSYHWTHWMCYWTCDWKYCRTYY